MSSRSSTNSKANAKVKGKWSSFRISDSKLGASNKSKLSNLDCFCHPISSRLISWPRYINWQSRKSNAWKCNSPSPAWLRKGSPKFSKIKNNNRTLKSSWKNQKKSEAPKSKSQLSSSLATDKTLSTCPTHLMISLLLGSETFSSKSKPNFRIEAADPTSNLCSK